MKHETILDRETAVQDAVRRSRDGGCPYVYALNGREEYVVRENPVSGDGLMIGYADRGYFRDRFAR